jgi:hypothetical protein
MFSGGRVLETEVIVGRVGNVNQLMKLKGELSDRPNLLTLMCRQSAWNTDDEKEGPLPDQEAASRS